MHLKTCFDNIVRLDIVDSIEILSMFSIEGEKVPFAKTVRIRGQVEGWLFTVQEAMKETLTRLMKTGLADYHSQDRKSWVLSHFG